MRSLRTAPALPLVFLLMTAGAFGTEWSVKYNQQKICALNGSTVFMNGTFTHPKRLTVNETFWFIDPVPGVELTDLSKDPVYSGRVEFFTDDQKHFSLKLSDVMKKDEHQFYFRIITNVENEKWAGVPGVRLRVTELHVEAPEEVTKGETADLTCKTTCRLTDPTFIWYKNGRCLTTKTIKNKRLHLQTVSSEDAGSYSCAVGGSQHLRSTAHSLRVRSQSWSAGWFAVGGGGFLLIPVLICICSFHRMKKRAAGPDHSKTRQNADPKAQDDTYTAIQPSARSSDDVYHTLAVSVSSQILTLDL
ncbi:hypothetical protein SRHO_G00179190 [Serrasalmus rhombeus]